MTLIQWTAFVEVARTLSFTAAAETLGYSQPGVSRQVAALERGLDVRLLDRTPHGLALSAAGRALLPHARLVVGESRRGAQAAREATGVTPLVIGAVPSAAAALLPRALRAVEGPHATVVVGLTAELTDMVWSSALDHAVVTDAVPGRAPSSELAAVHLGDDEMRVVAPAGRDLGDSGTISRRMLAEETWIEDDDGSEALLKQAAARAGVVMRVERSVDHLLGKLGLVEAGFGLALVPGLLVPILRPGLAAWRLPLPVRRGIYLISRLDVEIPTALVKVMRDSLATPDSNAEPTTWPTGPVS